MYLGEHCIGVCSIAKGKIVIYELIASYGELDVALLQMGHSFLVEDRMKLVDDLGPLLLHEYLERDDGAHRSLVLAGNRNEAPCLRLCTPEIFGNAYCIIAVRLAHGLVDDVLLLIAKNIYLLYAMVRI